MTVFLMGTISVHVDIVIDEEKFGFLTFKIRIDEDGMHGTVTRKHIGHDITFGKGGMGGRCSTCHEDLTAAQGLAVLLDDAKAGR